MGKYGKIWRERESKGEEERKVSRGGGRKYLPEDGWKDEGRKARGRKR